MATAEPHKLSRREVEIVDTITVDKLEKIYNWKMALWQSNICRRKLLEIIERNRPGNGFNKIVCVDGGTFIEREYGERWMLQFTCVMDVADELSRQGHAGNAGLQVFVYSPVYHSVDRDFFARKGVTVLRAADGHPTGFTPAIEHMGTRTLLFDFESDMTPAQRYDLFKTQNGICVGPKADYMREESDAALLKAIDHFDPSHHCETFPKFSAEAGAFICLHIRWPKTQMCMLIDQIKSITEKVLRTLKAAVGVTQDLDTRPKFTSRSDRFDTIPWDDITLEHLEREFEYVTEIWKGSACRKTVLDLITSKRPREGWQFDKIVCLGTGSFCTDLCTINAYAYKVSVSAKDRTTVDQFAVVVDLAKELKERGHTRSSQVQIFAQEPFYQQTDIDLVESKGGRVLNLERPAGVGLGPAKAHMSKRTLLIEFRCSKNPMMWQDLCDVDMGFAIGDLAGFLRVKSVCREMSNHSLHLLPAQFRQDPTEYYRGLSSVFEQKYEEFKLPRSYEDGDVLGALGVYWPKQIAT